MSGPRVVLLAHTWDPYGTREQRVIAADPPLYYYPIILVSSGHAGFQGPDSPYLVLRSMINADLARPASGELSAWWRRDGNDVVVWGTLRNAGSVILAAGANGAAFTAMVYEPIYKSPFQNPVRGAVAVPLIPAVVPGGTAQLEVRVVRPAVADWPRVAVVALVDYRPAGTSGPYDVVQAARAEPAGLVVLPTQLTVAVVPGVAAPVERSLALSGPPVLTWTAATVAPWLEVDPATGTLPAAPVVRVHPDRLPPVGAATTVTLVANGAGMSFTQAVSVRVVPGRRVRRHPVRP
jgi:hypothetical protein